MKRLIAVGVTGSWEGDWQPAQGNEVAVVAYPVGEEERVILEIVDKGGIAWSLLLSEGIAASLDEKKLARYRVVKDGSRATVQTPTTVEMILSNGSSST